ncbi:MAG: NADH-quinone oxidoreductase subunit NuoK [Deltaproteobacteria bacterium]|nr:NADH-quinone oxidoreductase subunit NuoK [Deltaproteobacteria bacterium]
MMSVPISYLLFLSFGVFCFGACGFLIRKNALSLLICLELMLSGVNIAFVSFSRLHQNEAGNILYFLVITVAACESAVGLALILNFFRIKKNIRLEEANALEG